MRSVDYNAVADKTDYAGLSSFV